MATRKTAKSTDVTEIVNETAPVKETKVARPARKKIPLDTEVPVISNVKGGLIYTSTNPSGMSAEWDDFGSLQYLDLRDLLLMRNTQKRFFEDNWISLKDTDDGEFTADDIYKFLRVDDKYGDFYDADNIETFFSLNEKQMEQKVGNMSKGMKDLLAIMALDKVEHGEIDSVKKRDALSRVLGIKFGEDE